MRTTTELTRIRATIDRTLRPLALPERSEMAELHARLRAHIEQLLPFAEAAVDKLGRGSMDWYERRDRLDRVRRHSEQGLGDTALSAHVQLRHLARDCAALLDWLETER